MFGRNSIFTQPDDNGLTKNVIIFGGRFIKLNKTCSKQNTKRFSIGCRLYQKINDTTIY